MADIALRGLSTNVHQAIREAAVQNHRSINGEILARLEASVMPREIAVEELLARIRVRSSRSALGELEDGDVREMREAGRP